MGGFYMQYLESKSPIDRSDDEAVPFPITVSPDHASFML